MYKTGEGSRSRVLFPCSMPVEEPLVPIDRLETIPGHYGGVAIGGRRTTWGRAWLGRGRRSKEERMQAGGNHSLSLSLSLFLPPLLVRRQLNAPRFIMHETQDLFKEELRVCTRNRATVGDNDGPITGNKRYESGLFSTRLEGLSTRFFLPPSLLSISRVLACNRKGCQRKMLGVFPCVISPSLF